MLPSLYNSIAKGIIFTFTGSSARDLATITISLTDNHGRVFKDTLNSISYTAVDTSEDPVSVPFKHSFKFKTYFLLMQFSNISGSPTFASFSPDAEIYPLCSSFTGILKYTKHITVPISFVANTCVVGNCY